MINDRGHQRNTSFRRYVGQAHQASVGEVMQIDQLSKVGIDCDQDSVFRCGQLQQSPIPGISTQRPGFQNVMPLTLEPLGQTASGAPGISRLADRHCGQRVSGDDRVSVGGTGPNIVRFEVWIVVQNSLR
jgi:hypothetical protein